jgi:cation diffusion facilitator CzcD-associated flavoprotein CzcO
MTSIGIIGSGFGAIATAHELISHGHDDVRLWERSDELGGVWRDNTYPGAGCDVPSPLYSFSFAVNQDWSRRYALQPEILDYLRRTADDLGIAALVQYGHEVVSAHWDEDAQRWEVGFTGGETQRVDVLISAVGQLSRPRLPSIPGIADFAGEQFHSAEWDHDLDLTDKRVAAIGVGASAIQYSRHLAERAGHLTLFQRSANYIFPKPDSAIPRWWRRVIPWERGVWWFFGEQFSRGLDAGSRTGRAIAKVCRWHLERSVSDPVLREKLTPDYPLGCKRILFSNDFYPTVVRDDVTLETGAITRVLPAGVQTADGTVHEADVIVWGTGFDAQDFLDSIDITGVGGRKLATHWADGAHAYLGMHVPGFPNLLVSYGPNTNLGGGSIIYMLEAQARHMRQVLDRLRAGRWSTVEVTEAAEREFDERTQKRLGLSVWGQCDSWYRHPSGRITSNWPGSTKPFERATRHLDPAHFSWR